jgi:uncharacterized membrane protein YqjE
MPRPSTEDPRVAAAAGFFAHLLDFLGAGAAYFRARLQLAGLEAKEAAIHIAIVVTLLVGALVVVVFGYFFLSFFLVFGVAALIGGAYTWIWVTFGFAALHFAAALVLVLLARARLAEPMFAATLEEFRKDQEWLTKQKPS